MKRGTYGKPQYTDGGKIFRSNHLQIGVQLGFVCHYAIALLKVALPSVLLNVQHRVVNLTWIYRVNVL